MHSLDVSIGIIANTQEENSRSYVGSYILNFLIHLNTYLTFGCALGVGVGVGVGVTFFEIRSSFYDYCVTLMFYVFHHFKF